MSVAAVLLGEGPGRQAVDRQSTRPDAVIAHSGPWRDAVLAAGTDHDWLWLVDADTEPAPTALAALLRLSAGGDGLRPPVLLAGKVVDPQGALAPTAAPWPPLHDRRGAMDAAMRRLALVRMARWGSLLVRTSAIERSGPPRADLPGADDLEWTARLLRADAGYLVPSSVAVLRGPRRGGARQLLGVARALRADVWAPQERLWVLYATLLEGSRPSPSRTARATVRRLAGLPRLVRR
jgi:hypothetical protein